jgi:hypothetical protein
MDTIPGLSDLSKALLSQCGLASAFLCIAIIWLALQLAKLRAACEEDRQVMMKAIDKQNDAYETLAVSHSKLEGILLALQSRGSGH